MAKAQAEYGREHFERVGKAISELGAHMQGYRDWPVSVVGLSIRGPRAQGDEFLVTIRGVDAEGERWVAFHSAYELHGCLLGAVERARNGTLRWKEDTWAK